MGIIGCGVDVANSPNTSLVHKVFLVLSERFNNLFSFYLFSNLNVGTASTSAGKC